MSEKEGKLITMLKGVQKQGINLEKISKKKYYTQKHKMKSIMKDRKQIILILFVQCLISKSHCRNKTKK